MALSVYQLSLIVGMLITGSINTLSKKPRMIARESFCLIGLIAFRYQERRHYRKIMQLGDIQEDDHEEDGKIKQLRYDVSWCVHAHGITPCIVGKAYYDFAEKSLIFQWIFILPTFCDLLGTTLAGIGLLYVTASVWQMLRGSIVIFTGIFSMIFFKRKLKCYQWSGIMCVMFGLVLVGSASIFEDENPKALFETLLGIILILAGQACNAFQMVMEEMFLKQRGYPPLQVVGMEGSFGFWIMCLLVLPALYLIPDGSAYTGRYEDAIDALMQIGNSPKLLVFCLLYLFSITFYNYFGLAVTKSLTAIHRTLIDACRTIVVWVTDLIIFYAFGRTFGESFNVTYGILQVDGFIFLIIGTCLYNGVIDLSFIPCLREQSPNACPLPPPSADYETNDEEEDSRETAPLLKNRRGQNYD